MTATGASRDRDVLPRWRFLEAAASLGDLEPLRAVQEPGPAQDDFSEQLGAFHNQPGLYTAGDLLSAVRAAGVPGREADPAAALVLGSSPLPGEALAHLARLQLEHVEPEQPAEWRARATSPQESIAQLRGHLRLNPRNPLRWVDLSLAQATLGHHDRATKSMLAALTLAPGHRHVLRSAARLFLLHDDFERAFHVLSSGDVVGDPWLAAPLVSISQLMERPLQRIRDYRDLLTRSGLAPRHLGELASELATVELRAGNDRRARKLLLQALGDPTENALAQVEWAREQGVSLPPPGPLPPHPFEAGALVAFYDDDYERALELGKDWQTDQPFDPRPATFVSYVASLGLEDYETAARACEVGLVANPADSMLRNNYVFALAASGDARRAAIELRKLPTTADAPRDAAVFEATRGLVAYRAGDPAEGRARYSNAVTLLARPEDPEIAALVALLWVGEERRVGGGGSLYLLEAQAVAEQLSARTPSRTVRVVKERVLGVPRET